ncbi:hypothetical protein IV203_001890 [Nitzschia inconspicua]|uniref:Uncharacterized protein n=1 Tax=Nitzschia inconspicua TaxID=303405 RepID=A0A9K3L7S4_9STRA|nr:hypothetical protein IV203_001890 [Nitzschia inconspicua]
MTISTSTSYSAAEGLTRRLIGLARTTQRDTSIQRQENDSETAASGEDDDRSIDWQHHHNYHRKRKRWQCGKWFACPQSASRVSYCQPLRQRMLRCCCCGCPGFAKQQGEYCLRTVETCWARSIQRSRVINHGSSTYTESNGRDRPTSCWARMRDMGQQVMSFSWSTDSTTLYASEIISSSTLETAMSSPAWDDQPLEHTGFSNTIRSGDLENDTVPLVEVSTQKILQKTTTPTAARVTSDVRDPFFPVRSPISEVDLEMAKAVQSFPSGMKTLDSPNPAGVILLDYTVSRVDNLPAKPDLEIAFEPLPLPTEDNSNNKKSTFGNSLQPLGDNDDEDDINFFLRFPNAESMKQRSIDQRERAERTSDFLETAKSLTLQLSSRRGSVLSSSSHVSSVDSSYDTSMTSSTPTKNDRGRRQQRRGSFLAGSKIERFDTSRSSSRQKGGTYKRYSSQRISSSDVYSQECKAQPRNSIGSLEQQDLKEEENRDMERMKMELGYEYVDVPSKSYSEDVRFAQSQQERNHGHLGTVEATEQLKRSRRRHGTRRSSFVSGSKIELYGGGKKSRKQSDLRASM